ncbi:hypothetical protein PPERSA_08062 [Pseudocohnilembus persalinus]|uniref:PIPK domain-containing protein n=1 Tax=Pseudocohnilembus persalinus TaxID=266149 RepID=A0A0V0R2L0_PSEPJ|nr:hypothetical protein PPERSA_08062 [Pseudocohnilembus persalinus]|eukprot:KRX08751.1 hypothetical protein PPERSA_08062 [Pseudocohnilembus persalinus]
MCFCSKSRKKTYFKYPQTSLHQIKNWGFGAQEQEDLRKKFMQMSKGKDYLNYYQFKEIMGVLGMESVGDLYTARIFNLIKEYSPEIQQPIVRFEGFAYYVGNIYYGSTENKAKMAFKMIAGDKDYFDLHDFSSFQKEIFQVYMNMTGQNYDIRLLEQRITALYQEIAGNGSKVTLERYIKIATQKPDLLDAFEFISKETIADQNIIEYKYQQIDNFKQFIEQTKHFKGKIQEMLETVEKQNIQQQNHINNQIQNAQFNNSSLKQDLDPKIFGYNQDGLTQSIGDSPQFAQNDKSINFNIEDNQKESNDLFEKRIFTDEQKLQHQQELSKNNEKIIASTFNSNKKDLLQSKEHQIISVKPEANIGDDGAYIDQDDNTSFEQEEKKENGENKKTHTNSQNKINISNYPEQKEKLVIQQDNFFKNIPHGGQSIDYQFAQKNCNFNNSQLYQNPSKASSSHIKQNQTPRLKQHTIDTTDLHSAQDKLGQVSHKLDELYDFLALYEYKLHQNLDKLQKTIPDSHKIEPSVSTKINVHKRINNTKKFGKMKKTVMFGTSNWNLVISIMIGIHRAVQDAQKNSILYQRDFEQRDYKLKNHFELLPIRRDNDRLSYKISKFIDYAPLIFKKIREMYLITSEEYLRSIGPETMFRNILQGDFNSLSEVTSTGKSGSFFYYTPDGKYTVKTISKNEFIYLKALFYGMHKMRFRISKYSKEKVIYIVVMPNVFQTKNKIGKRYDLKGSLYHRTTKDKDPATAKKDLDFINEEKQLVVDSQKYESFIKQIKSDSKFFAQNNIIDYSLLLGIHFKRDLKNFSNNQSKKEPEESPYLYYEYDEEEQQIEQGLIHRLDSEDSNHIYYFGIIDILTLFKMEYIFKRVTQGPDISAIPPQEYKIRFDAYIERMFSDEVREGKIHGKHRFNDQEKNLNQYFADQRLVSENFPVLSQHSQIKKNNNLEKSQSVDANPFSQGKNFQNTDIENQQIQQKFQNQLVPLQQSLIKSQTEKQKSQNQQQKIRNILGDGKSIIDEQQNKESNVSNLDQEQIINNYNKSIKRASSPAYQDETFNYKNTEYQAMQISQNNNLNSNSIPNTNPDFFFDKFLDCVELKWSEKMTLCAGTCDYKQGISRITLSKPILQYRTNNDIKETLLHEMIHAYLFMTNFKACQTEQGHGPEFQKIMHALNAFTGLNITVYHNFHDEVDQCRKHIWKCDGVCKYKPPYYGICKRAMNRPPGPNDPWFMQHQQTCGGKFQKIAVPEKKQKITKKQKKLEDAQQDQIQIDSFFKQIKIIK